MEQQTDLFGIPVPSTDPVFLGFVVVHIAISLVAVVSGLMAMLVAKTSLRHKRSGSIYFWAISFSFLTIIILSLMRWPHNVHLLTIGVLTFCLTFSGRKLARKKYKHWTRIHTVCMGFSYVLLLTGFYVDNGKNLPFWRMFPAWFFYVFPSVIGIPIIIKVLLTHPLNRRSGYDA
jgi:hypothetical protein